MSCPNVLKTDPKNPLILEYVPVLKEKVFLDLQEAAEAALDVEDTSSENNEDESDDDENSDGSLDSDASEAGSDNNIEDSTNAEETDSTLDENE
ncbi:UNVERIFIED_CONTAM: hypothetical protein HDU68_000181 [Siphonaria sp. JEL0065]|nr:hypothetical protein HDU68_000181 [Siphonaria sp. JEL0065]